MVLTHYKVLENALEHDRNCGLKFESSEKVLKIG